MNAVDRILGTARTWSQSSLCGWKSIC